MTVTTQNVVQYRLDVRGSASDLDSFVKRVARPGVEDKLFVPSLALPPPKDLAEVDPFAVPYYFLVENQYAKAADAFSELDIEADLVALLRDPAARLQAQAVVRERLDRDALQAVTDIRSNVRRFNLLTRNQWAKRKWGGFDDRLVCSERERVSEGSVRYQFEWHLLCVELLDQLCVLEPQLAFGMVAVDEAKGRQAYAWQCEGRKTFAFGDEPLHPVELNWLEEPPAIFRS